MSKRNQTVKKITQGLSLLSLFFIAISCSDGHRVFEQVQQIENGKWLRKEYVTLDLPVSDTIIDYNLFYTVRNTVDYPFYNLYLRLSIEDSIGSTIIDQDNELFLFHPNTGVPTGKHNYLINTTLGGVYDHRFPIYTRLMFPHKGNYKVKIKQFMRNEDHIDGILAIGLRLDKSK